MRRRVLGNWGLLLLLLLLSGACRSGRPVVPVRVSDPPAPLEPEIARLRGAHGFWMADRVYGGNIYVITAGPLQPEAGVPQPPALVLVHGLGDAGVRDYYPVFAALARRRHVVAFDLPGFGRSGRANAKYAPAGYAAVLADVITRYTRGPVDVVGHSMGGAISILHAATYPAQVRRLVAVDAAGILHREALVGQHLRRAGDAAGPIFPRLTEMALGAADTIVKETRRFDPAPEVILEMGFLRQKILRGEPGRIAALSLILQDFGPALSALRAPTLLVWGANDGIAPLRTGHLLVDRIRQSQLTILDGVGHNPMEEAPVRLAAAIEGHLGPAVLPPAAALPAAASHGDFTCQGESDVTLAGVYESIVLDKCPGAILDGVSTKRLVLRNSSASLVHTAVSDGVTAEGSQLIITGGRLGGAIGLDLSASRADLAGVSIEVSDQPYRMTGDSHLLFSVCPVTTGGKLVHMQGFTDSTSG